MSRLTESHRQCAFCFRRNRSLPVKQPVPEWGVGGGGWSPGAKSVLTDSDRKHSALISAPIILILNTTRSMELVREAGEERRRPGGIARMQAPWCGKAANAADVILTRWREASF